MYDRHHHKTAKKTLKTPLKNYEVKPSEPSELFNSICIKHLLTTFYIQSPLESIVTI